MFINRTGDTFPHAPLAFDSDEGEGGDYTREDLEDQAERAVEDGRAMEKIANLLEDNHQLREERRQLRDQMPEEDEVVLSASEAKELRDLGVLGDEGVETDSLEDELEQGREARQQIQQIETKRHRKEVAETAGVNPDALEMATKALDTDVDYEIQGEGENASVVVKPEEGDPADFDAFAEEHFTGVQKALYDTGSEDGGEEEETEEAGPDPSGPSAPSTQAGEGNRPSSDGEGDDEDNRRYRFESDQDAEW